MGLDLAGEADFIFEAFEPGLVLAEEGGEELEGDGLVEGDVVGAVDLAHAAAAEEFDDAVAACDDGAGHEASGVDEAGGGGGEGGGGGFVEVAGVVGAEDVGVGVRVADFFADFDAGAGEDGGHGADGGFGVLGHDLGVAVVFFEEGFDFAEDFGVAFCGGGDVGGAVRLWPVAGGEEDFFDAIVFVGSQEDFRFSIFDFRLTGGLG